MKKACGLLAVGAMVVAVVTLTFSATRQSAYGKAAEAPGTTVTGTEGKSTGGPRYTVIETQGFNLLVTDNASNKLYYYATAKDVPVGSPLKLRASLDLSQIGEKEIMIKAHNLENIRKKEDKSKE
jgi:hypothetical protein